MTADEVMLKKKDPPPNPLFPDMGSAKPYPLKEIKVWDSLRKMNPKPYIRVRNMNAQSGTYDSGARAKPAFEIGLSWSF